MKTQGTIESITEKSGTTNNTDWRKISIVINGKMYSTFDDGLSQRILADFKTGDLIELDAEKQGQYNTLKDIRHQGQIKATEEKLNEGVEITSDIDKTDYLIIRQSSLKEARAFAEFVIANKLVTLRDDKQAVDLILNLAETFVQWVLS